MEGHWDGQWLEQTYRKNLRQSHLFSLKKQRLRGDIIAVFHYVKWDYRVVRDRFFSVVHSERTRNNRHQFSTGNSDLRKKIFTT